MKSALIGISLGVALSLSAVSYASEKAKDKATTEYDNTTSHNGLTKTTTHTTIRKSKRNLRNSNGKAATEDQVKVEKKTSDDGTKSSVRTETVHTDEQSK